MNETNPQYFLRLYLCSNSVALQKFEHVRQLGPLKTTVVLHPRARRNWGRIGGAGGGGGKVKSNKPC